MSDEIKKVLDNINELVNRSEAIRVRRAFCGNRRKFTDDESKAIEILDTVDRLIDSTQNVLTAMVDAYFPTYYGR